jgi:hypothetical protein
MLAEILSETQNKLTMYLKYQNCDIFKLTYSPEVIRQVRDLLERAKGIKEMLPDHVIMLPVTVEKDFG